MNDHRDLCGKQNKCSSEQRNLDGKLNINTRHLRLRDNKQNSKISTTLSN